MASCITPRSTLLKVAPEAYSDTVYLDSPHSHTCVLLLLLSSVFFQANVIVFFYRVRVRHKTSSHLRPTSIDTVVQWHRQVGYEGMDACNTARLALVRNIKLMFWKAFVKHLVLFLFCILKSSTYPFILLSQRSWRKQTFERDRQTPFTSQVMK